MTTCEDLCNKTNSAPPRASSSPTSTSSRWPSSIIRLGLHERPAQFEHFFRRYPNYGSHKAGYCVNAGLEWLLDWMQQTRATDEDIEYLRSQRGLAGERIFGDDFLNWLRANGHFEGISCMPSPKAAWSIPTRR